MTSKALENESIGWRSLLGHRSHLLSAARILLIFAIADVGISLLLSATTPAHVFLSWYLKDNYEEAVENFFEHEMDLIPDPNTGWRNRPNTRRAHWATGPRGERLDGEVQSGPIRSSESVRVFMLGNSMINGGLHISNDQTLSHFLEDERIEAFNFGSMDYSIDQSLLLFQTRLSKFKPDVVVVGVTNDVYAVTNMFIPFRRPEERYMPFLKPRFVLDGSDLRIKRYSSTGKHRNTDFDKLLAYLRQNDGAFWRFESFRYLGVMPLSRCIREAYVKLRTSVILTEDYERGLAIKAQIISDFKQVADENGTKLLLVSFVSRDSGSQPLHKRFLPDKNLMLMTMLGESGVETLVVPDLLDASGLDPSVLYYADSVHLTPRANRLVAEAIRNRINEIVDDG